MAIVPIFFYFFLYNIIDNCVHIVHIELDLHEKEKKMYLIDIFNRKFIAFYLKKCIFLHQEYYSQWCMYYLCKYIDNWMYKNS